MNGWRQHALNCWIFAKLPPPVEGVTKARDAKVPGFDKEFF
jgi:hypothetical protein